MRIALSLVLVAALGVAVGADEKSLLTQALEQFKAGKFKQAVELTSKIKPGAEDYFRGRFLAGEAYLKLGDPKSAEAAYRIVVEARPKAAPALAGLGRALTAQANHDEAEKLLRKAIKLDPKHAGARLALGELQLARDQLGKARATLRAAHKLAPTDPFCTRALVEVLLRSGDLKGSTGIAKAFIKARPEHPTGHFLRGLVLDRTKKVEQAIEAYERALHYDKRYLDAHKNLAILCQTSNAGYKNIPLIKKALHHYERYFELGGRDKPLMDTWRRFQRFVYTQLDIEEDEDDEEEDKDDKDKKDKKDK